MLYAGRLLKNYFKVSWLAMRRTGCSCRTNNPIRFIRTANIAGLQNGISSDYFDNLLSWFRNNSCVPENGRLICNRIFGMTPR